MGKLLEFLIANPVNDVSEEVYPSQRFKGAGLKFKVKAVNGDDYSAYQKQAMILKKGGKADFDNKKFSEMIIFNHVVEPSFISAENIKAAGCATPTQFLYKSLLAGEIDSLVDAILRLSGFKQDMDELVDEAKN